MEGDVKNVPFTLLDERDVLRANCELALKMFPSFAFTEHPFALLSKERQFRFCLFKLVDDELLMVEQHGRQFCLSPNDDLCVFDKKKLAKEGGSRREDRASSSHNNDSAAQRKEPQSARLWFLPKDVPDLYETLEARPLSYMLSVLQALDACLHHREQQNVDEIAQKAAAAWQMGYREPSHQEINLTTGEDSWFKFGPALIDQL